MALSISTLRTVSVDAANSKISTFQRELHWGALIESPDGKVRTHIAAGGFHYIGKEASTRWGGGPDPSMLAAAGELDPADETFREYERVVDPKYLDEIRALAKQFSTKRLSRQARLAEATVRKFKNRKNTIRPRSLLKLTRVIYDLQNKKPSRATRFLRPSD